MVTVAWCALGVLLNDTQYRFLYDASVEMKVIRGVLDIGSANSIKILVIVSLGAILQCMQLVLVVRQNKNEPTGQP